MIVKVNGNDVEIKEEKATVMDVLSMPAVLEMLGMNSAEACAALRKVNAIVVPGGPDGDGVRKMLLTMGVLDGYTIVVAVKSDDDDEDVEEEDEDGDEELYEDTTDEEYDEDDAETLEERRREIEARVNAAIEHLPGIVTVEASGRLIAINNIPITQGETKIKDVIHTAKVRARTGMDDNQIDKCCVLLNNVPVSAEVTLRDKDVVTLTTVVADKTSSI